MSGIVRHSTFDMDKKERKRRTFDNTKYNKNVQQQKCPIKFDIRHSTWTKKTEKEGHSIIQNIIKMSKNENVRFDIKKK